VIGDDVTASVTVYVNVIDVNDNSPEFSDVTGDVTLVASVSEDADVGSSVTAVSAADRDSGTRCLLNVEIQLASLIGNVKSRAICSVGLRAAEVHRT